MTRFSPRLRSRETVSVLAISGLLGALVALHSGVWHVAVESAQVVAGDVVYPRPTSFFVYHLKTWTLLHQLPALLLKVGLGPDAVSLIVTAACGMLGFQGMSLIASALGANLRLALMAPVLYVALGDAMDILGHIYPIAFLGAPQTYGALCINFILVALGLLGCGHLRSGWFMLWLAPAFHLALGAWGLLIALLATALDWPRARATLRLCWRSMALGVALVVASYAQHAYQARGLPEVSSEIQDLFLQVSLLYLDDHRPVVSLRWPPVVLNLCFAVLAAFWLVFPLRDLPARARVMLAALTISALLAVVACYLTRMQEDLPSFFMRAMPGRYLNVVTLAFPAVLVGLSGAYWDRLPVRVSWVWLFALLLLPYVAPALPGITRLMLAGAFLLALARLLPTDAFKSLTGVLTIAAALTLAYFVVLDVADVLAAVFLVLAAHVWLGRLYPTFPRRMVLASCLALTALFASWSVVTSWRGAIAAMNEDPALAAARRDKGMLLTGSNLTLIQLQTGRPVLFCGGALDMIPYVPQVGPEIQQVLFDFYGIDIADPLVNRNLMDGNHLFPSTGKQTWERRGREQWRRLAEKYGVADVLVYKDWKLQLELVAESDKYRLYRLPSAS